MDYLEHKQFAQQFALQAGKIIKDNFTRHAKGMEG